jgi:thioredoxin-related protein
MDSSLRLDGSFTVSLFYNCVAVYDESRRNFDYFANIKSAAAGNKVMLLL